MKSPTIDLDGRQVILLTGACKDKATGKTIEIETIDLLIAAAQKNPDAVAFGYTARPEVLYISKSK